MKKQRYVLAAFFIVSGTFLRAVTTKTDRIAHKNVLSYIETTLPCYMPEDYVSESPKLVKEAQDLFEACVGVVAFDAEDTIAAEEIHNLCIETVESFFEKCCNEELCNKKKSLSVRLAYSEMKNVIIPGLCISHNVSCSQKLIDEAWKLLRKYLQPGEHTVLIEDLELVCEEAVVKELGKKESVFGYRLKPSIKELEEGLSEAEMASLIEMASHVTRPLAMQSPVHCEEDFFEILQEQKSFSFSKEPAKLDELDSGVFYQIRSLQQEDAECGCYVKYNALVINSIIENGESLSQQAIEDGVSVLVETAGTANWVDETTVFADLDATLSGHNVYMLKVEQDSTSKEIRIIPAGSGLDKNTLSMDDFWESIRNEVTKNEGYFVVNFDQHHWVLVVVLKQEGKKGPAFLYLDSLNNPIEGNDLAQRLKIYFELLAVGSVSL